MQTQLIVRPLRLLRMRIFKRTRYVEKDSNQWKSSFLFQSWVNAFHHELQYNTCHWCFHNLVQRHHSENETPHLLIDEFNGSLLPQGEAKSIKDTLQQMEHSWLYIICQSMNIRRKRISHKMLKNVVTPYGGNEYEATGMKIKKLNFTMRSLSSLGPFKKYVRPIISTFWPPLPPCSFF